MRTPTLYPFTRGLARVVLTVYFRKLEVEGLEHVPQGGPVILAANHPQSITDALVLGVASKRMVCYLAHSGLFRNRILAWFLRQHGVIPVYRREDVAANKREGVPADSPHDTRREDDPPNRSDAGRPSTRSADEQSPVERNVSMFAACHEVMRRGGVIGVFPEGTSADAPRVQRLKTGTARIALQSEDENGWSLGVRIVPVGLNFESRRRFRSRILVRFGAPLEARELRETYTADPVGAVNALTNALHRRLRDIVINIEHAEFDDLMRDLELVYKDELLAREGLDIPGDTHFKRDQWLSRELPRALDWFLQHRPELIWRVRLLLRQYHERLERLRIQDATVRSERGTSIPGAAARFVVWGALGLPFALYGALWNVLPYKLTGWLADRRAPDETKVHYFRLAFGAPLYLAYYGILLYVAVARLGGVGATLFAVSLPVTGLFARVYTARMAWRRDRVRLGFLELHHGYYVRTLRQQRRRLIRELDTAAGLYAAAARFAELEASARTDTGSP